MNSKVRIGKAAVVVGVSWAALTGLALSTPAAQANPVSYVHEIDVSIEAYVVDTGLRVIGSVPPENFEASVPPEKRVKGQ